MCGSVSHTVRRCAAVRTTPSECVRLAQVDWDKGHALLHLLAAMGLDVDEDVLPIYIGDDRTDEDAFRALRSRAKGGLGILVSSKVSLCSMKKHLSFIRAAYFCCQRGVEFSGGTVFS